MGRGPQRAIHVLALAFCLLLVDAPRAANADGSWLDGVAAPWNSAGISVPAASPPPSTFDPRCLEQQRPPETAEDNVVAGAGWMLIGEYESGWGVRVILAASYFDGMCRPLGYQYLIFADGLFAGTVSPSTMDSRSDGAASRPSIQGPSRISLVFARYRESDPLCCPSRQTFADYRIDRDGPWPVLTLTSVFTNPTGA